MLTVGNVVILIRPTKNYRVVSDTVQNVNGGEDRINILNRTLMCILYLTVNEVSVYVSGKYLKGRYVQVRVSAINFGKIYTHGCI